MKMWGRIGEKNVVLLIDSGATSNFISEKVALELGLPMSSNRGFGVVVGGGQVMQGKGRCSGVQLDIQGVELVEEFLLFELGTTDVVLGFTWLVTLGDTRANWKLGTLSWKIGNMWVTIKADPELSREPISLKSMEKVIKQEGGGYLLELTTLFEGAKRTGKRKYGGEVQPLLSEFQEVFEMPRGLPPNRNRAHAITLQEGVSPVNSRP